MPVQRGDLVSVHYTTKSLEGGVIETSTSRDPVTFEAGSRGIIAGVSEGVIGMEIGESRSLTIPADHAFGRQHPEYIQSMPKDCLPDGIQAGDQLSVALIDGTIDVWVQRVMLDEIRVDANHPLAGETIVVHVELVSIESNIQN